MLIDTLRSEMNASRKNKDGVRTVILSTLIGEMNSAAIVKDGVKVVTDKIALSVLKRAKKNLDENIQNGYGSIDAQSIERQIVESLIPEEVPLMDEAETRSAISEANSLGHTSIKDVMYYLKANYEGRFDGKIASKIVKEQN